MSERRTRIWVRVSPGARRREVLGRHGEAWRVRVPEAAERGRANDGVVRLLADTLSLPRRQVTLLSGHRARDKMVELEEVDPGELERRLSAAERKDD